MQIKENQYFIIQNKVNNSINCYISGVLVITNVGNFNAASNPDNLINEQNLNPFYGKGDSDLSSQSNLVTSRQARLISMTLLYGSSYNSLIFLIYEEM